MKAYLGWDVIEGGEPPVQVVPTVEWPNLAHILDDDCWCYPYRDGEDSQILHHRQEAWA